MRTTVTLETGLAEKLKDYAHRRRLSFKQALNEVLRCGLQAQKQLVKSDRFEVEPHLGEFRPGIDPGRLNQLLDELEVNDFVREASTDK